MANQFFLKLFGVPELRDPDGNMVKFRTRKQFALLRYAATDGRQ